MCWPTNKDKLACFTLFTLFFGGDRFAPLARAAPRARRTGPSSGGDRAAGVDGEPVQGYLQRHYCAAMARLAAALRGEANVVGFGSMNERPARVRARAGRARAWTVGLRSFARRPLPGLIGRERLDALQGPLRNGAMPTPLEAMALGSGAAVDVGVYAVDSRGAAAPASPARFRPSQETVGHLVSRAVGSGPSRSGGPRGGSGSTARSGRPGSRATTASGSATASGPRARTARRCS